ncbi:MAG: hypothetical protein ACE5HF_05980 [Gemmatimonadota bacterium]
MSRSRAMAGLAVLLAWSAAPVAGQDAPVKPPLPAHELEGRTACLMCHSGAMEAIKGVPESHEGRPNEICAWCHAKDAAIQTTDPPMPTHDMTGRDNCLMCHKPGAIEMAPDTPADHEGRGVEWCLLCHSPPADS